MIDHVGPQGAGIPLPVVSSALVFSRLRVIRPVEIGIRVYQRIRRLHCFSAAVRHQRIGYLRSRMGDPLRQHRQGGASAGNAVRKDRLHLHRQVVDIQVGQVRQHACPGDHQLRAVGRRASVVKYLALHLPGVGIPALLRLRLHDKAVVRVFPVDPARHRVGHIVGNALPPGCGRLCVHKAPAKRQLGIPGQPPRIPVFCYPVEAKLGLPLAPACLLGDGQTCPGDLRLRHQGGEVIVDLHVGPAV